MRQRSRTNRSPLELATVVLARLRLAERRRIDGSPPLQARLRNKGLTIKRSLAGGLLFGVLAIPLGACQPDYSKCPTRGAGQVRVAVVVDARAIGGATSVVCVVVASGSTGVTALGARATRLGTTPPRYNSSGLLCAIDGRPTAPACGNNGPNGYEYWSYWLGGTSWQYAPIGPAGRTVQDQSVDGWRFLAGGAAVAPNTASSFAALTS